MSYANRDHSCFDCRRFYFGVKAGIRLCGAAHFANAGKKCRRQRPFVLTLNGRCAAKQLPAFGAQANVMAYWFGVVQSTLQWLIDSNLLRSFLTFEW